MAAHLFIGESAMKTEIKRRVAHARLMHIIFERSVKSMFRSRYALLILFALGALLIPSRVMAQAGSYTIWGDIKVDDSKADTSAPLTLTIVLYDEHYRIIARQVVPSRGRYRFGGLEMGEYDLVIEGEAGEITRVHIAVFGPTGSDFKQDFEFEWKSKVSGPKPMTGIISATDMYDRPSVNKSLFEKAQRATEKKKYDEAIMYLKRIVENDKQDFQSWSLLGTTYLVQEKYEEAEKAYLNALVAKPTFALALLNLGRLRSTQKRFAEAIAPLTSAVQAQPQSAQANLLLGEAYLQIRKGSKAIPYLEEAGKLGLPDAYLRLAWLYNAAGLKARAAAEYEEFLKKKPQYPDRKKLEQYISANKKAATNSQ
jgi:Tfp pilus assembly protein PilF